MSRMRTTVDSSASTTANQMVPYPVARCTSAWVISKSPRNVRTRWSLPGELEESGDLRHALS